MRKQLLCRLSESRQSPAHRVSESACSNPLFPPRQKGFFLKYFCQVMLYLPVSHNVNTQVCLPFHHPLDHGGHLDRIPHHETTLQTNSLFFPLPRHLLPFSSSVSKLFPFSYSNHFPFDPQPPTNLCAPPLSRSNQAKPNSPLAVPTFLLFEPVPDGPLHPGPHHRCLHHHPLSFGKENMYLLVV